MTFNFTLVSEDSGPHTPLHIIDQPQVDIAWTNARVVRKVQGLLSAHQQCVTGACSSVCGSAKLAGSVSWLISRGASESSWPSGTPSGVVRSGIRWCSAMEALSAYMTAICMWGGFLEKNSSQSAGVWWWSILWWIMVWAHTYVGLRRWNCLCDQVEYICMLQTCVVPSAQLPIQHQLCFKDDSYPSFLPTVSAL